MQGTFESKNIYNMEYFIDQKQKNGELELLHLKVVPALAGRLVVPLRVPAKGGCAGLHIAIWIQKWNEATRRKQWRRKS